MKFFRSHIARLSGFLLLMLGITLHYAKPQDSKADHSAFTNWLESHLKTSDDDVLSKLDELSTQKSDLDTVIREASEIVASHRDDFELPVSDDDATDEDNYNLLLKEWKDYNTSGKGMGKAVLIQNLKPQTILPSDGHFLASALNKRAGYDQEPELNELYTQELSSGSYYILSPLKSGTAINAP